jgi:hypothetical protein
MGNPAGVRRDFVKLEQRRREAAELLRQGVHQAEVARRVGAHRQSVSRDETNAGNAFQWDIQVRRERRHIWTSTCKVGVRVLFPSTMGLPVTGVPSSKPSHIGDFSCWAGPGSACCSSLPWAGGVEKKISHGVARMGVVRMRASVGSVARTRSVYWLDAERRLVPAFLPLPASRWWLCSPAIHRQQNRRHTARACRSPYTLRCVCRKFTSGHRPCTTCPRWFRN